MSELNFFCGSGSQSPDMKFNVINKVFIAKNPKYYSVKIINHQTLPKKDSVAFDWSSRTPAWMNGI